ncbi:BrnA antitoxin family protein [Craurococcus roseus]|uniref:BrnA antitoxin family protein n=1 Tax=Craurococcus roseus TaxID=77585 RepID=A0ABN1EMG5_9PROT
MRKEDTIKKYSADELLRMAERGEDRTDLTRLKAMSEAELERSIAADPDWRDVPRDWYRGAEAVTPRAKVPVSIRLDADLVEFFRGQGRGWQTRVNAILRAYAEAVKAG